MSIKKIDRLKVGKKFKHEVPFELLRFRQKSAKLDEVGSTSAVFQKGRYIYGISAYLHGIFNHASKNVSKATTKAIVENAPSTTSKLEFFSGATVEVTGPALNDSSMYMFVKALDIYKQGIKGIWRLENEAAISSGKSRIVHNLNLIKSDRESIDFWEMVQVLTPKRRNGHAMTKYLPDVVANILAMSQTLLTVIDKEGFPMMEKVPLFTLSMPNGEEGLLGEMLEKLKESINSTSMNQDDNESFVKFCKRSKIAICFSDGAIDACQRTTLVKELNSKDGSTEVKYKSNVFNVLVPTSIRQMPAIRGDALLNCFLPYGNEKKTKTFNSATIANIIGRSRDLANDQMKRFFSRLTEICKGYASEILADGWRIELKYIKSSIRSFSHQAKDTIIKAASKVQTLAKSLTKSTGAPKNALAASFSLPNFGGSAYQGIPF